EQAGALDTALTAIKAAIEGSDVAAIREATNALQQAAQPLAQAIYAEAQQAASAADAAGGNGGHGGTEDEVVEDADYEVIDEDEAAKA
ncbi:MAG: molecular chaperone DnaK, partial [Thermoleophilia bacterium]|nr:molecular chaperone DnaK [Thermoleophilia bacterium]